MTAKRRLGRPPADVIAEGERRQQILAVAMRHFGERGFADVSLGAIAAEVGVTKAALYHHFPSKAALYAAMMAALLALILEAVAAVADAPLPTPEKLRRLAQMMILEVPHEADRDAMLRDVAAHLAPAQQQAIYAGFAALQGAFEEIMRAGIVQGELRPHEPRLLAHAFTHLVDSFGGVRGSAAGIARDPAVADLVVNLFLHGAAVPPAPIPPA